MFYVDRPVPTSCVSQNSSCPYKEVCEIYQKELHDSEVSFELFAARCVDRRHPDCEIKTDLPQQDNGRQLLEEIRELMQESLDIIERGLVSWARLHEAEIAERYANDARIYRWVINYIKKLENRIK